MIVTVRGWMGSRAGCARTLRAGVGALVVGAGSFTVGAAAGAPPLAAQIEPEVFAPEGVSVPGWELFRGSFSPYATEFFFFRKVGEGEDYRIFVSRFEGGRWRTAEPVGLGGDYSDLYPTVSPDGRFMVFSSYRPIPGSAEVEQANLWMARRDGEGWAEPVYLEGLSDPEVYNSGPYWGADDVLRYKAVTWGPDGMRLHRVAHWNGRAFEEPTVDPDFQWEGAIDGHFVWDATPSPDGSMTVLVVSRVGADGRRARGDLWISHRDDDGGWTRPEPPAGVNDPEAEENFVTFTPDGATLLFVRDYSVYYRIPVSALRPDR